MLTFPGPPRQAPRCPSPAARADRAGTLAAASATNGWIGKLFLLPYLLSTRAPPDFPLSFCFDFPD